jgi:hypothetical protein
MMIERRGCGRLERVDWRCAVLLLLPPRIVQAGKVSEYVVANAQNATLSFRSPLLLLLIVLVGPDGRRLNLGVNIGAAAGVGRGWVAQGGGMATDVGRPVPVIGVLAGAPITITIGCVCKVIGALAAAPITITIGCVCKVIGVPAVAPITIGCVCKVILMLLWLPGKVNKQAA